MYSDGGKEIFMYEREREEGRERKIWENNEMGAEEKFSLASKAMLYS